MTEDQLVVNKTAITLQTTNLDLDLLLPDVNWCDKLASDVLRSHN